MQPYYRDKRVTLFCGDNRTVLEELPEKSVQTVITSPPYYGLRDYGVDGQIGLEKTPQNYIAELVTVFRKVWRVLRDDGTLWLNLGDSYNGSGKGGVFTEASAKQATNNGANIDRPTRLTEFKPKDLLMIPHRVAIALQADGWYVRSDIVWHKPNPMPESVTDRPTKSHEYIFLMSKNATYYYDYESIRESLAESTIKDHRNGSGRFTTNNSKYNGKVDLPSWYRSRTFVNPENGRNRRSVWTVPTQSYKDAHFATFPEDLIKPCVLAGSKAGDVVLDPFNGAGTTGKVAKDLNRQYVGIELNPAYCELTKKRVAQEVLSL